MKRILCSILALAAAVQGNAYAQVVAPTYTGQQAKMNAQGVFLLNPDGTSDSKSAAATSTPCTVSATTSAATPAGCAASGSAGNYVVGPFSPQAGYAVRLVTMGTWVGSVAIGTSVDGCTTINSLTVAGQPWGSYTGNANEAVDVPATTGGIAYCLSISLTSGTINAALRQ